MHVHFIIPGDISTLTGGYIYDRRIIEELPCQGIAVRLHALDSDFPFPSPLGLVRAASEIDQIGDGSTVIIDGLALAPLHEVLRRHAQRLRLVGLVHNQLELAVLDNHALRETGVEARLRHCANGRTP